MPELPEVETMRRGVQLFCGHVVSRIERPRCAKKPISIVPRIDRINHRLSGVRVKQVGRKGKRLYLLMDSADALVIEPRMTGLVLAGRPPDDVYLRLRIKFCSRRVPPLVFWDRRGLGTVRLMSGRRFQRFASDRIGVDALEIDRDSLMQICGCKRLEIKTALMDQRLVAGIGNIYASEILHLAAVHPQARCDRLDQTQWQRIADATLEVLNSAIESEGSTLSDGTYRNALNNPGDYQNYHRVYDRHGQPCASCQGGNIRRIIQAGRSTFFCPKCQTKTNRRTGANVSAGVSGAR